MKSFVLVCVLIVLLVGCGGGSNSTPGPETDGDTDVVDGDGADTVENGEADESAAEDDVEADSESESAESETNVENESETEDVVENDAENEADGESTTEPDGDGEVEGEADGESDGEPEINPEINPEIYPSLVITAEKTYVNAGDVGLFLVGVLKNADDTITWSMTPQIGTLSAASGSRVTYTPPASISGKTKIAITAQAGDLSDRIDIEVDLALSTQTQPLEAMRYYKTNNVVEFVVLGRDLDYQMGNEYVLNPW